MGLLRSEGVAPKQLLDRLIDDYINLQKIGLKCPLTNIGWFK
jgi:hypothetical protein